MKAIAASIVVLAGAYSMVNSRSSMEQLIGLGICLFGVVLMMVLAFRKD